MVQILSYAIIQEKDTGFPYLFGTRRQFLPPASRIRIFRLQPGVDFFSACGPYNHNCRLLPRGEEPPGKILVFGFHSLKMEEEMYGYLFL